MGRQGDSGAAKRDLFQQQALPHLDNLYTTALYLTRNPSDAQDLLQETVLRAYRFFHQFTPGTNCRAWLLTILYNNFRNGFRRASREQVALTTEGYEHEIERQSLDLGPTQRNPESIVLDSSMDQEVEAALRKLPEDFRAVLLLIDLQELSYEEAARVLAVPVGTVRSRLSRGRALMRTALRGFAISKGYTRS